MSLSNSIEHDGEVSCNQWVVPENEHDDFMVKKEYLLNHHLFAPMIRLLEDCRKEGILGQIQIPQMLKTNDINIEQFSIEPFLEENQLSKDYLEAYMNDPNIEELSHKLYQLKHRFNEELKKLSNVCQDFKDSLMNVLKEQSLYRPVLEQEVELKMRLLNQKFNFILSQLRKNVCSTIVSLMKQYDHPKKKRRQLSKSATNILNEWFTAHINDPYPNDIEKQELASQCGLSVGQVNNWFGNKRIRTKRKHPELATLMSKDSPTHQNGMDVGESFSHESEM